MAKKIINVTLDMNAYNALSQGGERVVSKVMERNVRSYLVGSLTVEKSDFESFKTAITLPDDMSEVLKARATELQTTVSSLLRVIAEKAVAAEQGTQK